MLNDDVFDECACWDGPSPVLVQGDFGDDSGRHEVDSGKAFSDQAVGLVVDKAAVKTEV